MERYDFEIVQGGVRGKVAYRVAIADASLMWSRIRAIAKSVGTPGSFIRVVDQEGNIVVLIGVSTAIRLCSGGS
jgi:hypothetical protein